MLFQVHVPSLAEKHADAELEQMDGEKLVVAAYQEWVAIGKPIVKSPDMPKP